MGRSYRKLFSASIISNLGDGVGLIAYPWLASAVTRNPLLIALVAMAQRLPWLLFTLPAGVITDRVDRRRIMVSMNGLRAVLTLAVAAVVVARESDLPSPDLVAEGGAVVSTDLTLYLIVLVATLLLGSAEVLYDNSAQTILPSIVETDDLEKANGRLWAAESVANSFAGPPLAALLIAAAFSAPFFFDAGTFVVSAALISLIPSTAPTDRSGVDGERPSWVAEAVEGLRWLWSHELLRPMAIILGLLNALGSMTLAILVLYSQEVLDTSPTEFALLSTGLAFGSVIGGWTASWVSQRIGPGPSLYVTMLGGAVISAAIGLVSHWPIVWALMAAFSATAILWNVITVSLRQAIIPDRLLGRVNSVYRFFGWGMMPLGTLFGGLVVLVFDSFASREFALRAPWLISGALHVALFAYAAPKLTTAKIEAARAEAADSPGPDTDPTPAGT